MLQPTASQAPKGLLPKGSRLQGEVTIAQGLRIEGEVHGHVRTIDGDGATLVVAEGAVVFGSLEAPHVVVHGQVQGPIVATQSLQVMEGAKIAGDLQYRHLVLHPQATVHGRLLPMLGMPVSDAAALPSSGEAETDATDSELDNGPNHDAGKPDPDLSSHEDAVPLRPNPA